MIIANVSWIAGDEVDEDVFGGGVVMGSAVGPHIAPLRVLWFIHHDGFGFSVYTCNKSFAIMRPV